MSGNPPPLTLHERLARAAAIRCARREERMALLPFGLVPSTWLASISGLTLNTCKARAMSAPVRLDAWDVRHWGDYPSTFGPWVAAWGLDRVLAFLDAHDTERAAYLRANVDGLDNAAADREAFRAEAKTKHDAPGRRALRRQLKEDPAQRAARLKRAGTINGAKRAEEGRERRAEFFADVPVGLVPLSLCAMVSGQSREAARARLDDLGLPMVSGVAWPTPAGSWSKLIDAWGEERARAWVLKHVPADIRTFERDVRGAARASVTSDLLMTLPIGLLPDTAFASFGAREKTVTAWRKRNGIKAQFGAKLGRFDAFVAKFGREGAREWLAEHAPKLLAAFDADMEPKDPPKVRDVSTQRQKAIAKVRELARDDAQVRRRPTVPPRRVDDDEDKRAAARASAQSVAEWLAAGGRVTVGPGAGWADPASPNYRPDLVRARRGEERKRWGKR